jgi:Pectate lyase superfamily protein
MKKNRNYSRNAIKPFIAFFLFAVLNNSVGQAEVIRAASPSFADVRTAVSRTKTGDTVIIPAGSATWSQQLILTKGVSIIGAGIGQTVITSGYSGHSAYTSYLDPVSYLIAYTPSSPDLDEAFRLSGFTIDFNAVCYGIYIRNHTTSPLAKIRIDHCNLSNSYSHGMELILTDGTVYGCIDNNVLSGGYFMFRCFGLNETTWKNLTFSYGTGNNLYFEDNIINSSDSIVEGGAGGRYCFRHNTINLSANVFGIFDVHGNGGVGGNNATMGVEIYENTINWGSCGGRLSDHRGGMALIYNNDMVSTSSYVGMQTREEYLDSLVPPATNPKSGQPQHVSDSYYWDNTKNGSILVQASIPTGLYPDGGTVNYGGTLGVIPQWNRDCWQQGASFDGTVGVGLGPLSSRPATCKTGVAYWATDMKTLYRATAPNTWSVYYTPYAYPHPLRNQ